MPKLIENLRERILSRAKAELLERGYDALNIRAVARDCGIAVGTVYNYFSSKEMLAAAVMAEDWRRDRARIAARCAGAGELTEAVFALYEGVDAFSAVYRSVWAGFGVSKSARDGLADRHRLLVRQLAECLEPALGQLKDTWGESIGVFLAENVLLCASGSELRIDELLRIVRRLAG